jgi:hypothetical protein
MGGVCGTVYLTYINLPGYWFMQAFLSWVAGFLAALYGTSRRWCHPGCIVAAVGILLVGFCNDKEIDLQVPGGIPIFIPGPMPDGTSTPRVFVGMLAGVTCILVFAKLHDFILVKVLSTSSYVAGGAF